MQGEALQAWRRRSERRGGEGRSYLYLPTSEAVWPEEVYTMMREACTLSAARTADDAIASSRDKKGEACK